MTASIEFMLPKEQFDPSNNEDVLRAAGAIQSIIYKGERLVPPEIREGDRRAYFPHSNDYWLHPPGNNTSQKEGHWRLDSRYDKESSLQVVVENLLLSMN